MIHAYASSDLCICICESVVEKVGVLGKMMEVEVQGVTDYFVLWGTAHM